MNDDDLDPDHCEVSEAFDLNPNIPLPSSGREPEVARVTSAGQPTNPETDRNDFSTQKRCRDNRDVNVARHLKLPRDDPGPA